MGLFLIEGRIPMQETINYLKKLTSIVSPTGYTKEIADYLEEEWKKLPTKDYDANKVVRKENDIYVMD